MKKLFAHLLSCVLLMSALTASAQYCGGSGPGVCTPGGPYPQLGFYPSYFQLPCAEIGVAYNQKIDMQVPATIVYSGLTLPLNWVKIDTIENLPCGLCWSSSDSSNQFSGNSTGCVRVTGTTFDKPGQYKLRIIIDAQANFLGSPTTLYNQDAESFGIKYYIRVSDLTGNCASVDTLAASNTATQNGTISTPVISGATTICSGSSTTLSIPSANYYAYKWSNGAITSSINVAAGGTYSVTAYAACTSATASTSVTVDTANATISASGPLTFCSGGSVTLSAPVGNDSYLWSNNSTSSSITVNQSGTYTVTATKGTCTASDSKTVTVTSNNLNPTITPDTANICSGGIATLDAGNGFDTYSWSQSSSTQSIQTGTAGTYTVTVTLGTCSGTASALVNVGNFPVSVNISPAGPVSRCDGDTVTLDGGSGFDTYGWSNTDDTQITNVTTTGNYILNVTKNGCNGSDTVAVNFNSLPSPTITSSGNDTICDGETVLLDAGSGFDTYQWSNNSTTSSIVVSNTGTYNVTVTQNGCSGSAANPVAVTVNSVPDAYLTVVTDTFGDGMIIAPSGNGFSYQWQQATNFDTTGQLSPVTNTTDTLAVNCDANTGYYRVIITNTTGCTDTSGFAYIAPCTGIMNMQDLSSFLIMPNPTRDRLNISYRVETVSDLSLNLTDLSGREVKEIWNGVAQVGAHAHQVSLSGLPSGIYLLHIRNREGAMNYKVVKQ